MFPSGKIGHYVINHNVIVVSTLVFTLHYGVGIFVIGISQAVISDTVFIGVTFNVSPVERLTDNVNIIFFFVVFNVDKSIRAVVLSVSTLNGIVWPFGSSVTVAIGHGNVLSVGVSAVEGLLNKSSCIVDVNKIGKFIIAVQLILKIGHSTAPRETYADLVSVVLNAKVIGINRNLLNGKIMESEVCVYLFAGINGYLFEIYTDISVEIFLNKTAEARLACLEEEIVGLLFSVKFISERELNRFRSFILK